MMSCLSVSDMPSAVKADPPQPRAPDLLQLHGPYVDGSDPVI